MRFSTITALDSDFLSSEFSRIHVANKSGLLDKDRTTTILAHFKSDPISIERSDISDYVIVRVHQIHFPIL